MNTVFNYVSYTIRRKNINNVKYGDEIIDFVKKGQYNLYEITVP